MTTRPLVMITGASAGIGQETARVFAAAGYPLLLIARRNERIEAMDLPNTLAIKADVRDYDAVAAAVRQGEEKFGPVDCLINNAGVAPLARLDEQDPGEWRDLIDINCLGVLNGMHIVAPGMKTRRCGTIINVSSIAGRKSYPQHDVYCGTKHFVHAVSEGMRQTMSAYRVRVMVISPGVVKSDIEKTMTNKRGYDFWNRGREAVDGGIDACDVARTMLFAYQLPQTVTLQEMTITPTGQEF